MDVSCPAALDLPRAPPSRNVAVLTMSEAGNAPEVDRQRLSDEVEALSAIYGEENVSFSYDSGALNVCMVRKPVEICMSCMLPARYPSKGRPLRVTLCVEGMVRARCEEIVEGVLASKHERADGTGECLFDYCNWLVETALEEAEANRPEAQDVSAESESAAGGILGCRFFGDGSGVRHGEPLTEKKSVFQAHAARIDNVEAAQQFTAWLLGSFPKLSGATHHIMAYRVGRAQDCDDDGESGAGKGLLFTLQQMDADNTVVVVTRWFGGTKLGPARFKLINNAARQLLSGDVV